jgi:formamidopyrimidine-DNA glycosylase
MIELPEAVTLAGQLNAAVRGRRIVRVIANQSPHKWAWFRGDPQGYVPLLVGRTLGSAASYGGFVAAEADGASLLFGEGVTLRLYGPEVTLPARHQLLVELDDGASLVGSVQMYGGLWAYGAGTYDNPYLAAAIEAPSPLGDAFTPAYFEALARAVDVQNLSVKALLATEQRIPGLGNGVLQDILFTARLHPKRKVSALAEGELSSLHRAVRGVLGDMAGRGGRDTERDLYGAPGGYRTLLSRNTVGQPCPTCGTTIQKTQYMGGSVYFCRTCQPS